MNLVIVFNFLFTFEKKMKKNLPSFWLLFRCFDVSTETLIDIYFHTWTRCRHFFKDNSINFIVNVNKIKRGRSISAVYFVDVDDFSEDVKCSSIVEIEKLLFFLTLKRQLGHILLIFLNNIHHS